MALKRDFVLFLYPHVSLAAVSAYAQSWRWGVGAKTKWRERQNWARSQQRAAALIHYPESFSHTAIFRYWALSAKKINGGGAGREGVCRETKRVGPAADSFCLPHLRQEAASGFLLQSKGSGETPPGPTQFASPERAVYGNERRILPAAELTTERCRCFLALTL